MDFLDIARNIRFAFLRKNFALVHRNMLANISSRILTMLIYIVVIPIYLRILGKEAYGLVSFQAVLQIMFSFLELGLPATITREMGKSDDGGDKNYYQNLIYTIEHIMWVIGFVIVLVVAASSFSIASKWLRVESLPQQVVVQSIMIMGGIIAVQLCSLIYGSALRGLERQEFLAMCTVSSSILRGGGAILLLSVIASDIRLFMGWNLIIAIAESWFLRHSLYAKIPKDNCKPVLQLSILKRHRKFSTKIIGNSVILSISSQIDKLAISKSLSLDKLGYYSIAGTAAGVISVISGSFVLAIYPGICREFKTAPNKPAIENYIRSTKLLALFIWPIACFLFYFSSDVLLLWTKDVVLSEKSGRVLSFLAMAIASSGMALLPIYLAIAADKMKYMLIGNIILLFLTTPVIVICVAYWGLSGAAASVMVISILSCSVIAGMIHKDILGGQQWRWLWNGMLLPSLISFVVATTVYFVIPISGKFSIRFCLTGIALILCYIGVISCRYIVDILKNKIIRQYYKGRLSG